MVHAQLQFTPDGEQTANEIYLTACNFWDICRIAYFKDSDFFSPARLILTVESDTEKDHRTSWAAFRDALKCNNLGRYTY